MDNIEEIKKQIEKEIEDKKISHYKLEGYIAGLMLALSIIDSKLK